MSFFIPATASSSSHRRSASSRPSPFRTTTYTYGASAAPRSPFFAAAAKPGSASSSYKRRARDGYIARLLAKIRRLLRDLWRYVRRNPVKVLLPLLSLLVSSGVLAGLAGRFGGSLPGVLRNAVGMAEAGRSVRGGYDAWYGSQNGGGGGGKGGEWLGSALKVAGAFV